MKIFTRVCIGQGHLFEKYCPMNYNSRMASRAEFEQDIQETRGRLEEMQDIQEKGSRRLRGYRIRANIGIISVAALTSVEVYLNEFVDIRPYLLPIALVGLALNGLAFSTFFINQFRAMTESARVDLLRTKTDALSASLISKEKAYKEKFPPLTE